MFKNYFTVAWRNLSRQSFYSLINITGLAVGITACLVILLFVADELSYDRYPTHADRIYRVDQEIRFGSNHAQLATCPPPMAHALQQDYPEIEATTRLLSNGTFLVLPSGGTQSSREQSVLWADSTFFRIFSIRLLEGNSRTALNQPAGIAISKHIADKYFPNTNALGKSLLLDNLYNAHVTAVFEDIPAASHFHVDILIALVGDWFAAKEAQSTQFEGNNFTTYLLLNEGTDVKALEAKLPKFVNKYVGANLNKGNSGDKHVITLMPLTNIHLHSQLNGELEPNGSIVYVYLFSTIAFLILGIACINFMNLSTARFGSRAREVGIRKVMGSLRSHLIRQFLTESTLITLFAFILATVLVFFLLPVFNTIFQKQLHLPVTNPFFYFMMLAAVLLVGVLAGIYPSFFLSAFKPVDVLKGQMLTGVQGSYLRSGLVIFQFVISIFLMVATVAVNRQIAFIQTKRLGFEKDHVLVIKDAYALRPNIQAFRDEAEKISSIESCTISGFLPVLGGSDIPRRDRTFWKQGDQPTTDRMLSIQQWTVDTEYINTFKMRVIDGRGFSKAYSSDKTSVVLNQAAVLQFGLGDDPIGKKINTFGGDRVPDFDHPLEYTVIGVVENFHFSSMEESISPLGLFLGQSDGFICARFNGSNPREVIGSLEKVWKQIAPGQPFQYSFLDEDFGKMYAAEQHLAKMFMLFTTLAMIIACLGLFALTTFMAEQRSKEIGIRKVLGASLHGIMLLLCKDFSKLILIAFILATPLAWYAMDRWLENYAYKTELGVPVFLLAGGSAFLLALVTVGYQSLKAATANPINSLKDQ